MALYLPSDYTYGAARALWKSPHVLITTGFYVDGCPETDGLPGAFFLGRALAQQGAKVSYVGEQYVLELLRALVEELWLPQPGSGTRGSGDTGRPDFIEFPIADAATSEALSREIISSRQVSAAVAIERCGRTRSGRYCNILGEDISPWTARVDDLFTYPGVVTIGVGDGGNEIGMGLLSKYIEAELGIADPVETKVDHLVLATVSNWGAYGIIARLSSLAGLDLLPAEGEEEEALEIIVANGAIDGLTRRAEPSVDGFSSEASSDLIAALRRELR